MTQDQTAAPQSEGWRPDPGDSITGTVTEVNRGWSDYTDSYYPIVTVHEDETGKSVDIHCFHEILKERMMDARPTVGQKLTVECVGMRSTRDGKREFMQYRVTVPGETGERVWDDLAVQSRRAGASARRPSGPSSQPTLGDDDIPF